MRAFGATETPTATPYCPRVTEAEATPEIVAGTGTPVAAVFCAPTGLGTPLAAPDYSITLTAGQSDAGPVDLTVTIAGADGKPVDGADIIILSQHLEMNHGISFDEAKSTGPGVYVAPKVSMGMGGDWQVEVQVSLPGQPVVAAVFEVKLKGPV